jgi:hypothetical protein
MKTGLRGWPGQIGCRGALGLGDRRPRNNQARLVVDYEYKRNIFLQARGSILYAQYLQSGGITD